MGRNVQHAKNIGMLVIDIRLEKLVQGTSMMYNIEERISVVLLVISFTILGLYIMMYKHIIIKLSQQ